MIQQLTYKAQLSQKRLLKQGLPHPAYQPYRLMIGNYVLRLSV